MKTIEQRFNNIIGQLEGVKKMSQLDERDCFAVIVQLKAIKSATAALMEFFIKEEFEKCLLKNKIKNKVNLNKFFTEIIKK
jgi:DNA-binding FrmR family transcriptional regulator